MEIDSKNISFLGQIRRFQNLKGAFEGNILWIKEITAEQADGIIISGIPFTQLYYQRDNLLFPKGSRLPIKKMRTGLLWSPLERLIPLELPKLNHNFFGIEAKADVKIVKSHVSREPEALLTSISHAKNFIIGAPSIRLQELYWVGIDEQCLFVGIPILPIEGQTFWMIESMFIPTGFDFEFSALYRTVYETLADGQWIVWNKSSEYMLIDKSDLMPLSRSSFRLTYDPA